MPKKKTTIDKEEAELLRAYEEGAIDAKPVSAKTRQTLAAAAERTLKKDRRINIRLSDHDLTGIQRKAAERGLPYQSLISGLIHQFVEGDLVEKKPH